ncbi:hypothetical protein XPR_0267 [Xanthomonas arboricola pv. pruni MAFF 301420]|uniref:Uncharacterized protein n=2 Tax=Xanthomonas arboricola pv. pruni TaxID=69929 RepID=W4SB57_9XANT|nr:major facilitator transporter [Xanthomonas arboricola pv. pruni str. MAFF 311562]GAE53632.1 hypothetical protein XPR_0267 [Xanthomonas arboricola pv. pruni MAFF 301420]GAE58356.1 hypothetical protein XPN_0262 [Xanthomonas arboricola pv. pruni MAFF 301427]
MIVRYVPHWCYYLHQGMLTALVMQGVVGYYRHAGLDLAQLSWLSLAMLPWVGKFLWAPGASGMHGHCWATAFSAVWCCCSSAWPRCWPALR